MNNSLSEKQQNVLDYLRYSIAKKGYAPSVRDICKDVGIKSTSTVHAYLKKLTQLGFIEMDNTISRSIRLPEAIRQIGSNDLVEVPIVGRVAAGSPILAVENIEDTFTVSSAYTKNSTVFMLKVKGESMIEAGRKTIEYELVDSYFGNLSYYWNDTLYISQTGSCLDELEGCRGHDAS